MSGVYGLANPANVVITFADDHQPPGSDPFIIDSFSIIHHCIKKNEK